MSDTALIRQFKSDPERGYRDLLDKYTPVILRMIRRFLSDPDDVMETYTAICERLRNNDFQALRRFRINSELTPWLSVVVANACRDRFRKNRMVSTPNSVISKLNKRQKLVFGYYYQDQMPHEEISEIITTKHGMKCSAVDVMRDVQTINSMLSVNKRWHLLAALRANRPMLSYEDLQEIGIQPTDGTTPADVMLEGGDEVEEVRLKRAIQELDADDQLLVMLRYEQGMRAAQIAKVMKFDNQKYVYTRLRTIVNRLRRTMTSQRAKVS